MKSIYLSKLAMHRTTLSIKIVICSLIGLTALNVSKQSMPEVFKTHTYLISEIPLDTALFSLALGIVGIAFWFKVPFLIDDLVSSFINKSLQKQKEIKDLD